jgi:hypothetical protein
VVSLQLPEFKIECLSAIIYKATGATGWNICIQLVASLRRVATDSARKPLFYPKV